MDWSAEELDKFRPLQEELTQRLTMQLRNRSRSSSRASSLAASPQQMHRQVMGSRLPSRQMGPQMSLPGYPQPLHQEVEFEAPPPPPPPAPMADPTEHVYAAACATPTLQTTPVQMLVRKGKLFLLSQVVSLMAKSCFTMLHDFPNSFVKSFVKAMRCHHAMSPRTIHSTSTVSMRTPLQSGAGRSSEARHRARAASEPRRTGGSLGQRGGETSDTEENKNITCTDTHKAYVELMIRKERCSAAEAQLIDVTAELSVSGRR
eukprot:Skav229442  [mRNA]  locus=scaffold397:177342:188982:- [translate_table: standard]